MSPEKRGKTEEQKRRERIRKQEKLRKKLIKTRFGHKENRHAKKGTESVFCGIIALFLLLLMVLSSYTSKGEVGWLVGVVAIITLFLAAYGFVAAIHGFRERDRNYVTCKAGGLLNGLIVLFMAGVFIRGLF